MSKEEINAAGMLWAQADLDELYSYTKSIGVSIKEFALQFPNHMEENIKPIIGINSQIELLETIKLMTSESISKNAYNEWWTKDLIISNRVLNPSLW